MITSLGQSYCLFGGQRWWQWDGLCGQLWKGFPLRGEGWHNWTKHIVSFKNGHSQTTYIPSHRPSEFPKAEGQFSGVLFLSASVVLSLYSSPSLCSLSFSLISCEMRPFYGMCGLIITDNHSLLFLPLFLFPSGSAVDSRAEGVDALQRPQTACQWGLALQQGPVLAVNYHDVQFECVLYNIKPVIHLANLWRLLTSLYNNSTVRGTKLQKEREVL